jgi:prepilin peptidase CpaA
MASSSALPILFIDLAHHVIPGVSAALWLLYPIGLSAAAGWDLATYRIPNRLTLGLLGVTLAALSVTAWPEPRLVMPHLVSGALVFALGFILHTLRVMGGGDVKLASVMALWCGPAGLAPLFILTAVLGGVLTLALLSLRRWPLPPRLAAIPAIARLHAPQSGVPYGVPLALAGLLVFSETDLTQMLLG